MTEFREIIYASEDYAQECRLRDAALRVPLGMRLADEDLTPERQQWHFGLFDPDGILLACVIAVPLTSTSARIRQMAVTPERQDQGLGRMLLCDVERWLTACGITHLMLHARKTAVGFYVKLGYVSVGEEFTEVTLPHLKMEKNLATPPAESCSLSVP